MEEYTFMHTCEHYGGVGACRVLDWCGVILLKAVIFKQMDFFAKAHSLESQVTHTRELISPRVFLNRECDQEYRAPNPPSLYFSVPLSLYLPLFLYSLSLSVCTHLQSQTCNLILWTSSLSPSVSVISLHSESHAICLSLPLSLSFKHMLIVFKPMFLECRLSC